jgi:hypothetical protein
VKKRKEQDGQQMSRAEGAAVPTSVRPDEIVVFSEPHIGLPKSVVMKGYRFRAVGTRIYRRPAGETFHSFLVSNLKATLGETWWKHQVAMPEDRRHEVVRWAEALAVSASSTPKYVVETPHGKHYGTDASGHEWALLSLGWDSLILQARRALPEGLVDRLRTHASFQGARYELAVASVMARAGFDIRYLDDEASDGCRCEMIAQRRGSDVRVAVETKSRVRENVHHSRVGGTTPDPKWVKAQVSDAKQQRPEGLPFLICLDLNTTEVLTGVELTDRLPTPSAESPNHFAALFLTNFPYHYGAPGSGSPPGRVVMAASLAPDIALDESILMEINEAFARYGRIPEDW